MKKSHLIIPLSILCLGISACSATDSDNSGSQTDTSINVSATESATFSGSNDMVTDSASFSGTAAAEADTMSTESDSSAGDSDAQPRKRRILPEEPAASGSDSSQVTADQSATSSAAEAPDVVYPSSVNEIVPSGKITGGSVMFVPNQPDKDPVVSIKKDSSYPDSRDDTDQILKGLSDYWAAGEMDSVDYLVRMDKFRYLSGTLEGSSDYYYYGDENESGEPEGTGVAVYAGNQYYYGSFHNGLREGNGFWYQIYVKNGPFEKANNGVYGHSYNGEWKNDLPDGQGQEHFDIDRSLLKETVIANMVGTFAGGYYNGDFKLNSFDADETETNWIGTCRYGTWVPFGDSTVKGTDGSVQVRVLQNTANTDNYYYMKQNEDHGQGIYNIVK